MELYQELLIQLLSREHIQVTFANLHISAKDLIEATAYQALCEIKRILEDESLEDHDCFLKIEEIIRLFEDLGSSGGNRHDT
ncbi:MAG: hypothetical protein ACI3VQ_01280 [Faecousia sp.]